MTGFPRCYDTRSCGAKLATKERFNGTVTVVQKCTCLTTTYSDGECPFCKPVMDETDGKKYPKNKSYVGREYLGNGVWT